MTVAVDLGLRKNKVSVPALRRALLLQCVASAHGLTASVFKCLGFNGCRNRIGGCRLTVLSLTGGFGEMQPSFVLVGELEDKQVPSAHLGDGSGSSC